MVSYTYKYPNREAVRCVLRYCREEVEGALWAVYLSRETITSLTCSGHFEMHSLRICACSITQPSTSSRGELIHTGVCDTPPRTPNPLALASFPLYRDGSMSILR